MSQVETTQDAEHLAIALSIIAESERNGRPLLHLLESDQLLQYGGGVWSEVTEQEIGHMTDKLDNRAKASLRHEVYEKLKMQSSLKRRAEFDDDPRILVLKNGLLHLDDDTKIRILGEHDPDYLSLCKLPVEYDPEAKCPKIQAFLEEVLPDEDDRLTVLEELATCLYRANPWQRFYVWVGKGANGKGTLIRVMQAILGARNVSDFSLHDLQNRFNSGNLPGKLANFGADIGEAEVKDVSLLKSITGEDRVTLVAKHVQAWESDGPLPVKFFFSANTLPTVKDKTRAFMRRGIITEWTEEFVGSGRDDKLTDKLSSPRELSGFLNLLLSTLDELRRRGDFARAPTIEETAATWAEKSDPVHSFVINCLTFRMGVETSKSDVHQAYERFCESRQFGAKNDRSFAVALKRKFGQMGVAVSESRKNDGRTWVGCELKPAYMPPGANGRLDHDQPTATPMEAKGKCPRCGGDLEAALHYRLKSDKTGQKEEVCRTCWTKDSLAGRKPRGDPEE